MSGAIEKVTSLRCRSERLDYPRGDVTRDDPGNDERRPLQRDDTALRAPIVVRINSDRRIETIKGVIVCAKPFQYPLLVIVRFGAAEIVKVGDPVTTTFIDDVCVTVPPDPAPVAVMDIT